MIMKNSKRGSSAVFLTAILAALFSITLALIYSVREESIISKADAVINLAGDSLLSEYDEYIQQEYGLFLIRGTDSELSAKLKDYIGYSLDSMENVSIDQVNASAVRYSAADVDQVRTQLLEYLKFAEAADLLNNLTGTAEESENTMETRSLEHGPTIASLPSASLPKKSLTAMAESLAENVSDIENAFSEGSDQYRISRYILSHFNNNSSSADTSHFFRNEAEYILGGELTDRKNEKRVEMALKAMRFPLNLAHIYSDETKLAAVTAMAELLTPGAAAAATQAALASTWAYAEADNDVELLWQGYKVPVVKSSSSWAIDLDSAVEGIGGTVKPAENRGYDYEQYLHVLLFFQDENIQTARLLDLIQINTRADHNGTFLIQEHSVGITVEVIINGKKYAYDKKY